RRRVPGRPKQLVGRRIIDSRIPCRSAANLPGVAFPRVMTRFVGTWDGVKPPLALSGVCVVGIDEAANSVLAARDTKNHEIFDNQWRNREAIPLLVVNGTDVPNNVASPGIEGDDVSVERAHENLPT